MRRIVPLPALDDAEAALAQVDAIFFASALTREFASDEARAAFRELWLGRYLRHFPEACFVALDEGGAVAGYLAATPQSNQPPLLDAFPAHIHVNVREDCRGQAIGSALTEAFRVHCRNRGIAGLHAVTAADSRAAAFFARCSLTEQAQTLWRGRRLVFLGQSVA